MKINKKLFAKVGMALSLMLLCAFGSYAAITVTMSTGNAVATANEIQFDVFVTNDATSTSDINFNSTVLRFTVAAEIIPAGTVAGNITYSYVGGSDFPLIWPPNQSPAFSFTLGSRLAGVSSGTGQYTTSNCVTENTVIVIGGTKKIGRFSIKHNTQNFVAGQSVSLTWNTTSSINAFTACSGSALGYITTTNRTLTAPGAFSIPAACTAPSGIIASNTGSYCVGSTISLSATTPSGGTAPFTYQWNNSVTGYASATSLTSSATISNATSAMSGQYKVTVTNACGFDVAFTNVVVNEPTSNPTAVSACDSYTWANTGLTYTASGSYPGTTTNCVTEVLNLTITPSSNNTTVASGCDSYTWSNNGTTYSTGGIYTGTTTNCVTEILDLTITPSSNNTTVASGCDSYTWSNNGTTYSTGGIYTGTTTNCVTEVLDLTITPSSNNTTVASACDSYTWSNNGTTYSTGGIYTGTTTNCVTEILNLTITPSSNNTTVASGCDSYTWSNNGTTYSTGGIYTGTTTNCVTEILNLTITPSSNNTTVASACDSYTWSNNGTTYSTGGIYTGSTTNCVTEVLNLTINSTGTNQTTTAAACGSYTWSDNDETYTSSGVYTGSTTNCVTQVLDLTITPVPPTPSAIVGNTTPCAGSIYPYSITPVAGTTYAWTAPAGGTVLTGQGTGSVTIKYLTASFVASGNLSVTGTKDGCTSLASTTLISKIVIAQPSLISGLSASVCVGNTIVYSVGAVPNATTYVWTLPYGASGSSSTNAIAVTYGPTFTGGDLLAVKAGNTCGYGPTRFKGITLGAAAATPGAISGLTLVCPGSYTYSVAPVVNAISYTWSLPSGATGSSVSNTISVTFDNTFAGGNISVTAMACAMSAPSSLALSPGALPSTPGAISGTVSQCAGVTGAYSVPLVSGVTYTWTAPAGASIASGQGTNSVTVDFSAAFTAPDDLSVVAGNGCGTSSPSVLNISNNNTGPVIGSILGTASPCISTTNAYSVALVSGTTYAWTAPAGATILSGQGTRSVSVRFTTAYTAAGNLSVSGTTSCGTTNAQLLISSNGVPPQPSVIAGLSNICSLPVTIVYSVTNNPSVSYVWTLPPGASGSSTTNVISISYGATFTAGGNLAVKAVNACGSSPTKFKYIQLCGARESGTSASIEAPGLDMMVYPNPATDHVSVRFNGQASAQYRLSLVDMLGRDVMVKEGTSAEGVNIIELSLGGYAKGIYLMNIMSGDSKEVIRTVIQ